MVTTLITGIASALPQLIMTGMQLLLALAQGITENLPSLIDAAIQSLSSFVQGILQNLPTILMTAAQIIGTLAQGIIGAIPQLLKALPPLEKESSVGFPSWVEKSESFSAISVTGVQEEKKAEKA